MSYKTGFAPAAEFLRERAGNAKASDLSHFLDRIRDVPPAAGDAL